MKIVVLEDEPGLQLGLQDLLEDAGYQVHLFEAAKPLLAWLPQNSVDLVILDLGLPDMDGTLFLEKFRNTRPQTPVLVLTARAGEADMLYGFKLGADDYVTKPFSPRLLLARVESLLRRSGNQGEELVQLGDLQIDFRKYQVRRGDTPIRLTTREFELLKFLHDNLGAPVSRHDILDEVWGMDNDAGPRTVDTYILGLRKKLEPKPNQPVYILSQRGIGYKLSDPEAAT